MVLPVAPRRGAIAACLLCMIGVANPHLGAQNPVNPDTTRAQTPSDTTRSSAADSARIRRLGTVTVTAAPAERAAPFKSTRIDATTIKQTPAHDGYDLLRQTAGVEVHEQGQGPGFASDASLRGFTSDHSTDLALWIDGVPINEPVNGHAEGYNDWSLIFPQAIQNLDVIKGPTSALFGNFAFSGIVNVRTLDHLDGTRTWVNGGSAGHIEGTSRTGVGNESGVSGVVGARY